LSPGRFVFSEHSALTRKLEGKTVIAILNRQPHISWVLQDFNIPVSVLPDARVLARAAELSDADCVSLADELALLLVTGKRRRENDDMDGREVSKTAKTSASAGPSSTAVVGSGPTTRTTFPLLYACDMIPGMRALAANKSRKRMPDVFQKYFQECRFVPATVYKHRNIFMRAVEHNLIRQYQDAGRTDAGRWATLVSTVGEQRTFTELHSCQRALT
jgi:hypothetical protein